MNSLIIFIGNCGASGWRRDCSPWGAVIIRFNEPQRLGILSRRKWHVAGQAGGVEQTRFVANVCGYLNEMHVVPVAATQSGSGSGNGSGSGVGCVFFFGICIAPPNMQLNHKLRG